MIEDLERQGLIQRLPPDPKKAADAMALARRDIDTARTLLSTDCDWAYTIAYNAALQAGRALMFAKGYRPDGANQHISVVKFAGLFLSEGDALVFDRMRRKRHGSVYDTVGTISAAEAEFAVSAAVALVQKVTTLLG